jgi:syndecan 4
MLSGTPEPTPILHELNLKNIEESTKGLDSDCDGISDFHDNCPDLYNPSQIDRNKNGFGDVCEPQKKMSPPSLRTPTPDVSICVVRRTPGTTQSVTPTPEIKPSINELRLADVIEIARDLDRDCDGKGTYEDNCPTVYNPDQKDRNNNGIGDACEARRKSKVRKTRKSH